MLPSFLVIQEGQVINNGGQWRNQTANQNIKCPLTILHALRQISVESKDILMKITTFFLRVPQKFKTTLKLMAKTINIPERDCLFVPPLQIAREDLA